MHTAQQNLLASTNVDSLLGICHVNIGGAYYALTQPHILDVLGWMLCSLTFVIMKTLLCKHEWLNFRALVCNCLLSQLSY